LPQSHDRISSDSTRSAQHTPERFHLGTFDTVFSGTRGELANELASELKPELVGEAVVKDRVFSVSVSSSESARSAQHTPARRTRDVRNSAIKGTTGEDIQELAGELARELAGELVGDMAVKDARLLQRKAPVASSSAAFSCTHSGSIKDRKGLHEL
jgi:hypothetical protein